MRSGAVRKIMNPSSIAIVGASNNLMKMGTIQCLNLINSGFPGDVLPVNPQEETVLGKKAYRAIGELPYAPDLAILVVPSGLIPEMLEDFGSIGTRHAIIITAGFKETGEEGRDLEDKVVEIAKRHRMRFLGPNCLGIINTQLPLNITVMPIQHSDGKLGLISQSGTYVAQTLSYLHRNGIAISKAMSVGNEANIDIVDCLEYLGEDDSTKAIALYIEGIRRADRFLEVARKISRNKPIVAQYVGGTEAGARSGSSHTGAMAGPDFVYEGLFEQAGVIRVDTIEEVYKIGWALASQPPLEGSRIAILTNSGGPGTAIANTLNREGLEVPEFSKGVQKEISQYLAGHASARNPVDLTFHVGMDALTEKIPQILFDADDIDGVVIHGIMDTGFFNDVYPIFGKFLDVSEEDFLKMWETNLDRLVEMPFSHGKPLVMSSFFGREDHAVRVFHENGIPVLDAPEKAARAMAALYRHYLIRKRTRSNPPQEMAIPDDARRIMETWNGRALDEYRAKKILGAYGIPTTRESLVKTLEEAIVRACEIGYPVVLKACSSDILHKTEEGMVYLGIENEEGLTEAFNGIKEKKQDVPVLVSEMLQGDREFMAGMSYFPGFPPCIMFGLGGVFTETLKDNAIRLAPLSEDDAFSMLESLSSRELLGPYRGMRQVDRNALAAILVTLGQIALHFPEIGEIDMNPIIIVEGRPKVVDALFVKKL
jgi:acyl-CoA synthetase (NDP forming)